MAATWSGSASMTRPAATPRCERGSFLDGEGVAGDVVGAASPVEDLFESGLPGLEGLAGQAVDEVEVDVVEAGVADLAEGFVGALG